MILERESFRMRIVGFSDHPRDYEADTHTPGVAYMDFRRAEPGWLIDAMAEGKADGVLVTPHWGPNMTRRPRANVRMAASALVAGGATPHTQWSASFEAVPIFLDHCDTRLARGEEAAWIGQRFTEACAEFGTGVQAIGVRPLIEFSVS